MYELRTMELALERARSEQGARVQLDAESSRLAGQRDAMQRALKHIDLYRRVLEPFAEAFSRLPKNLQIRAAAELERNAIRDESDTVAMVGERPITTRQLLLAYLALAKLSDDQDKPGEG